MINSQYLGNFVKMPQDQYVQLQEKCLPEFRRKKVMGVCGEGELKGVVVFEVVCPYSSEDCSCMYSTQTGQKQASLTQSAMFLEVIGKQQDSWSTSEKPTENVNAALMPNVCSGGLWHELCKTGTQNNKKVMYSQS